jgi:hypothetical protein
MQNFSSKFLMDFYTKIHQGLIYWNFLQGNNTQIQLWSSPLCRVAQEDSNEIYLAIFGQIYKFL